MNMLKLSLVEFHALQLFHGNSMKFPVTSAWTEVQSEVALPDVAEEQCEKVMG